MSRNVGVALGVIGLGYVALWWRAHASGAPLLTQVASVLLGLALSWVAVRSTMSRARTFARP